MLWKAALREGAMCKTVLIFLFLLVAMPEFAFSKTLVINDQEISYETPTRFTELDLEREVDKLWFEHLVEFMGNNNLALHGVFVESGEYTNLAFDKLLNEWITILSIPKVYGVFFTPELFSELKDMTIDSMRSVSSDMVVDVFGSQETVKILDKGIIANTENALVHYKIMFTPQSDEDDMLVACVVYIYCINGRIVFAEHYKRVSDTNEGVTFKNNYQNVLDELKFAPLTELKRLRPSASDAVDEASGIVLKIVGGVTLALGAVIGLVLWVVRKKM